MATNEPYQEEVSMETPLERAARAVAEQETRWSADAHAEREADVVVGDVDEYGAQTDPANRAQAEAALNAWQIPTSPLEGVPSDVALHPGEDGEPLVSIFSAQNESEANIVRGLLEAEGIAVIIHEVATPSIGSVFSVSEGRWADLLVGATQAQAARDAITAAQQAATEFTDEEYVSNENMTVSGA